MSSEILNFIPIENRDMSIFTALIFFFLFAGMVVYCRWIQDKIKTYDTFITNMNLDLTDMKVDIAETAVATKNIEKTLFELSNRVIEMLYLFSCLTKCPLFGVHSIPFLPH